MTDHISNATSLSSAQTDIPAHPLSTRQRIAVLISILLGMLLSALDQTIVGTAMPHVIAEIGGENLSWVYTAYLLASTVSVPVYGKLSDMYGRKALFLLGMLLFLIGSALSGTSQNMTQLILYRGIQGLGAGALLPIAQSIIGDIFPPAERGKWQGLFMGVFGLATIIGPSLGGVVTDTWGWRWVFYINMPIGLCGLIIAWLALPKQFQRRKSPIDYMGSSMLVLWSVPLLLGISLGGNQYAWNSWPIIGFFTFSLIMLLLFIRIEVRASQPIISPRLFENRIFSISSSAIFLLSAGMYSTILYLPYFVQDVMGQSATDSGIILTPMMLGFVASSTIGGQLLSRTGKYKWIALPGLATATIGMFLLSRMDTRTTSVYLIESMIITGLGLGVLMSLFTIVVQNAFPYRQLGEVTATFSFFRFMGGAVGLAILGSVLTNEFTTHLRTHLPIGVQGSISSAQITALMQTGGSTSLSQFIPPSITQEQALYTQILLLVKESFASALSEVFLIGSGAMVLAFLMTLFLQEIPLRKSHTAEKALTAQELPDGTSAFTAEFAL